MSSKKSKEGADGNYDEEEIFIGMEVENVCKKYGSFLALENVSLSI